MHPGHARRLRLERLASEGNMDGLVGMREDAYRFSRDPAWVRTVERTVRETCPHPDQEDGRCLLCGAWRPPYDQ